MVALLDKRLTVHVTIFLLADLKSNRLISMVTSPTAKTIFSMMGQMLFWRD